MSWKTFLVIAVGAHIDKNVVILNLLCPSVLCSHYLGLPASILDQGALYDDPKLIVTTKETSFVTCTDQF